MDSLFEPSFFDHLDPSSSSSSSFWTFSSLSDLSSPSLPEQDSDYFSFSAWDLDFPCSSTKDFAQSRSSAPPSDSDTSSPSPANPFQVIFGAFDAPTPAADIGIFHTGSKLGGAINTASSRSVSSADGWETLATPALLSATSSDSVPLATPSDYAFSKTHKSGFSWDDASTTLSSSSYTTPATPAAAPTATAHRVASASALSNPLPNPHKIRNVASMPALTEEPQPAGAFGWFDPTEYNQPTPRGTGADDSDLVDTFDWVFEQEGLGGMDSVNLAQMMAPLSSSSHSAPAVPTHTTLFSAFEESDIPVLATGDALDDQETVFDFSMGKTNMTWLVPSHIAPDVHVTHEYDLSQQLTTIDPMAMLAPSSYGDSRPSTAPHLSAPEGNPGMLSLPTSDAMHRSHTSPAYASTSEAPYRAVSFSYPSQPDPPYVAPPEFVRRASQPLSIQVNSHVSTFHPQPTHNYPLQNNSLNVAPTMTRGVTMPSWRSASEWDVHPQMNAAEAQRIAHGEMAKQQAVRAEMRQKLKDKVLPMMESSVMQPAAPLIAPRSGPPIVGWSGPSTTVHPPRPQAHRASVSFEPSMLTHTPLIVHPPPMAGPSTYAAPTHRVHPPPNPSITSRPIARLPSPKRNASGPSPSKRSPSGRSRKVTPGSQGFSWEDGMMFVNYTPKDADKLLSGVAPSGTQSKRKREEEAAAAAAKAVGDAVTAIDAAEDAERSKRARSGE